MFTLTGTNVCENYRNGVELIRHIGQVQDSRNGEVLVAPYPVMTVYEHPTERVLFDRKRKANPFFHLMEALWMLHGRNDVTWLDKYVSTFSDRFGEEDGTQYGAYGYRWRQHFELDQLDYVVFALTNNPTDRRVVISMWDTDTDLGKMTAKDLPCNTHIYPRIVNGALDLTIMCRSNDIVWGAYGANAVHFSMLQEYLAGRIGVSIGKLYQFSNNWHAYTDVLDKVAPKGYNVEMSPYYYGVVGPAAIGDQWDHWDMDLSEFMTWHDGWWGDRTFHITKYRNKWFKDVAEPMVRTWHSYKNSKNGLSLNPRIDAAEIKASDWRAAAMEWVAGND